MISGNRPDQTCSAPHGYSLTEGLSASVVRHLGSFTLSLRISCPPGETTVLTGPSGSGKTTLLRCLCGLESISEGFVTFAGECWDDPAEGRRLSPQARRVGFLFQEYGLFPHMTLEANIRFAAPGENQPLDLLDRMGIGHLRRKRPDAISGGERQRAALCQVLARRPGLLLLDEPFSALDIASRRAIRIILKEIQEERQLPVLWVTHDLVEAQSLSSRLVCLRQGREDPHWLNEQMGMISEDIAMFHHNRPAVATVA